MSEIEPESAENQGGGGSAAEKKRRKKRVPQELWRCEMRLKNGRRCEAAKLRNSIYCVFHDRNYQRRQEQLMFPIPYEHPDQVHWLLWEAVQDLKKKKLKSKEAYALGYLVTLLMQNQPKVTEERRRVEKAPYWAEVEAAVKQWFVARAEQRRKQREEREKREREEESD